MAKNFMEGVIPAQVCMYSRFCGATEYDVFLREAFVENNLKEAIQPKGTKILSHQLLRTSQDKRWCDHLQN